MVSNCFASEQGRDELTNTSALKFCLVYAYVKIAKISFNNKLIFHGLMVALYYLILNHNPATSVQGKHSLQLSQNKIYFFIRSEIISLLCF